MRLKSLKRFSRKKAAENLNNDIDPDEHALAMAKQIEAAMADQMQSREIDGCLVTATPARLDYIEKELKKPRKY